MGEMADAISCGDSDDKYALTVANRYFDKENAVKVSELEIKTRKKIYQETMNNSWLEQGKDLLEFQNERWVSLESLKARDVQRLKWVTEKEKELTLLNYPYGSHSSELKLIREVKSLLLVEEAKTQ